MPIHMEFDNPPTSTGSTSIKAVNKKRFCSHDLEKVLRTKSAEGQNEKKVPSFFCSQLADFVISSKKSALRAQHFSKLSEKSGFSKKARSARRICRFSKTWIFKKSVLRAQNPGNSQEIPGF